MNRVLFSRGFAISLDAMMGLVILVMIMGLAYQATIPVSIDPHSEELSLFAWQAAQTLESSQLAARGVILDNTTAIRSFLDGWPSPYCGRAIIFPSPDSNIVVFSVTKTGCVSQTGVEQRVRRTFIVPSPPDANVYIMEVSAWLNES